MISPSQNSVFDPIPKSRTDDIHNCTEGSILYRNQAMMKRAKRITALVTKQTKISDPLSSSDSDLQMRSRRNLLTRTTNCRNLMSYNTDLRQSPRFNKNPLGSSLQGKPLTHIPLSLSDSSLHNVSRLKQLTRISNCGGRTGHETARKQFLNLNKHVENKLLESNKHVDNQNLNDFIEGALVVLEDWAMKSAEEVVHNSGESVESTLKAKLCSHKLPQKVISTEKQLNLRGSSNDKNLHRSNRNKLDSDQSTSTTRSPDEVRSKKASKVQPVTFDKVHIRVYERILGDNPSCYADGPSISIGWKHRDLPSMDLDTWENVRSRNLRPRTPLRLILTSTERRKMAFSMGYSNKDIANNIREVKKIQLQRMQSNRANSVFSSGKIVNMFATITRHTAL